MCLTEGSKEELKEHLIEELDYVLVPEEAWNKLHSCYGLHEGQVIIGPLFTSKYYF